ncbi:MAG: cyclopropane-fatty-acyl-phospholipid synthase family protein [Acetobacteraceae bacterium]|nr:cyclopropane-fatty-acyl-phospholipid synthase family protein [Acetobacteraceae bacterium]
MKLVLSSLLSRLIRQGTLTVTWPDGATTRYTGQSGPEAGVAFTSWAAVRRIARNPALGFGEAYMDGGVEPVGGTIYDVLDLLMFNFQHGANHPVLSWHGAIGRLGRRLRERNGIKTARRNVAHHYDLDSRLYSQFLDADQQYSCAYFERGDETLEEAQLAKKHHIAAKLKLDRPGLRVLDIGCGWGGMALTLAQDYGADVTGVTLSSEQLQLARARAEAANLTSRVRFELIDYREVTDRFDRVVSVGMMEHVGAGNYGEYYRAVHDRLEDDGVALIHHIGRSDGPGTTSAWLQKYIFPGGYSPALSETLPAIEKSGLMVTDIEVLRLHYAQTLRLWRERFAAHRDDIAHLYDERFCRMFEFYLVGAELAFRREREVVYQIQLAREQTALPLTRNYMMDPAAPHRQKPAALRHRVTAGGSGADQPVR